MIEAGTMSKLGNSEAFHVAPVQSQRLTPKNPPDPLSSAMIAAALCGLLVALAVILG